MTNPPTIIELTTAADIEAKKAAWWRRYVVKLGPKQLAHLTGYTIEYIYQMERGYRSDGRPVSDRQRKRYWAACCGVDAMVRKKYDFDWGCKNVATKPAKELKHEENDEGQAGCQR